MDAQGLPIVSPKIDYGDVDRISPQRLLCFVNHFSAHTVAFLNAFASSCERRLAEVNWRIQRTEATLSVLEAKLSSIPGLDHVQLPATAITTTVAATALAAPISTHEQRRSENGESGDSSSIRTVNRGDNLSDLDDAGDRPSIIPGTEEGAESAGHPSSSATTRAKDHPSYAKYWRMLHLGVPLQAVILKCRVENPRLDAGVLETPNRLIPLKQLEDGEEEEEEEEDDDDGWSQ